MNSFLKIVRKPVGDQETHFSTLVSTFGDYEKLKVDVTASVVAVAVNVNV